MKYKEMTLQKGKFLFVESNRSADCKRLKSSIREKGVLVPITVISATDISDDIKLVNVDGTPVSKDMPRDNKYVVLDGQHRMLSCLKILEEDASAQKEYLDAVKQETKVPKKKNIVKPNVWKHTHIPFGIESKEKVGDNINDYITTINNNSKKWAGSDYIENAVAISPNDELVQNIDYLKEKGCSISTISRYLTFNAKVITTKTLSDHTNGARRIEEVNIDRGRNLYDMLVNVGFSQKSLVKRYLIDIIISANSQGHYHEICDKIKKLDKDTVDKIEKNLSTLNYTSFMNILDTSLVDNEELNETAMVNNKKDSLGSSQTSMHTVFVSSMPPSTMHVTDSSNYINPNIKKYDGVEQNLQV